MIKITHATYTTTPPIMVHVKGYDHAGNTFDRQLDRNDFEEYCRQNNLTGLNDSFDLKCHALQYILAKNILDQIYFERRVNALKNHLNPTL